MVYYGMPVNMSQDWDYGNYGGGGYTALSYVSTTTVTATPPPYADVEAPGARQEPGDALQFDEGDVTEAVFGVVRPFKWVEAADGAARVRGCSIVTWLEREGYIKRVPTQAVSSFSLDELRTKAQRRLRKTRAEPQAEPRPLRGIALGGV